MYPTALRKIINSLQYMSEIPVTYRINHTVAKHLKELQSGGKLLMEL